MNIQQPLFVIGSPRSGTSLLRLVLTSHSKIIIPPECGFIVWLYGKFSRWNKRDSINPTTREHFLNELYACKKFDTWALERITLDGLISNLQPSNYATLCALVYSAYMSKLGRSATIWGDKNNFHIDHLPLLGEIYPNARFLHIVRDGRDVACSYREVMNRKSASPYAPNFKTDIKSIGNEWSTNVNKVGDYLDKLINAKQTTVRYEDLVLQPEYVLSEVCSWLNLSYEPQMLAFHETNKCKQLEPSLTMDWKQRTVEPISADTVGRYRVLLSIEEQNLFNLTAGPGLAKYGYSV